MLNKEYKEAFTEIEEIFNLMPKELLDKIPNKFREMIKEEKDINYLPDIKEPLEKCKLKDETIMLLGLIYRDFLCDSNEKKKLQKKDAEELKNAQEQFEKEIREKYNPNDVFKREKDINQEQLTNDKSGVLVIKKEGLYNKIINFIKKLLRKNK